MGWIKGYAYGRQQRETNRVAFELEQNVKTLEQMEGDAASGLSDRLRDHLDTLTKHREAHLEAYRDGNGIDAAHRELKASTNEARKLAAESRGFLKDAEAFEKGAKVASTSLGKRFLIGAAIFSGGALALGFLSQKRNEAAKESRAAEREQQFTALDAENKALDQAMAQSATPQVGDRTLMGLEPIEGQHVASLGRSGRMTAVDRATQPQLTALSEQPAALGA